MSNKLTSNEIQAKLHAAAQVEADARTRLEQLQTASVLAGIEDSPEEREAAAALTAATADVKRLLAALDGVRAAEAGAKKRAELLAADADDAAGLAALDAVARDIQRMERAIDAYVSAWNALRDSRERAQEALGRLKVQRKVRPDLDFPNPERLVAQEITRRAEPLKPTAPGHNSGLALFQNPAELPSLTAVYASLLVAAKQDIEAAKARRETAAEWTV
jgi:hypothetical protein